MINPHELRIGNYVSCQDKIFSIATIEGVPRLRPLPGGIVLNPTFDEIEPIPLTSEILDKLGFNDKTGLSDMHLSPIHLMLEEKGYFMRLFNSYVNKNPIKYLHQLQNLYFAIAGKEIFFPS